ncbi:DUF456 domain-containing protein [Fulvivirga sp. M361]|uniref:DUF456 domain-containing protein n=1 Tax=Fulvivirga sp. M361 TaxID=2594266 RepID=UPI001179BA05|nr:DUF456 domain-containing protein [Fulvivirga sp. M361]TRX57751.1 DUF456 domain-containing protein [Fulvivirga sp. M361]
MDIVLFVIVGILMLVGIIGCFLPILPGPPITYTGLLLLQLRSEAPFSTKFMVIWLLITIAVTVLDYIIPAYGTKKYGGSRLGVIGTFAGLIIGLFFSPVGIIVGPLLGALIGEYVAGKNSKQALKAAWGSFVGFLLGSLIKLIACLFMCYYYFSVLF